MRKLLLLNGPNLNWLGKREPGIYGNETLQDVEDRLKELGMEAGVEVAAFQSNHEGALLDRLYQAVEEDVAGIIFNPGAYTHYSYALRDAVASIAIPVVEVHISNIHAREEFRHHSVIAPAAAGQIAGLGTIGYDLALQSLLHRIRERDNHDKNN